MQYANKSFMLLDFSTAVTVHNSAGMLLIVSYPVFFFGNIFTKNGCFYKINFRTIWGNLLKQARYYTSGIFKGEQPPFPINRERKFNPLQKIAYIVVMYIFLPLLMITGLALLFPEIIVYEMFGLSGTFLTALLHSVIGFLGSIFLVVHIYFSTMGITPKSNFKSMVNGWTEAH